MRKKQKKWFDEVDELQSGRIGFTGCCSDTITLDKMWSCILHQYNSRTFEGVRCFCSMMVYEDLSLSMWEGRIADEKKALDKRRKKGCWISEDRVARFHDSVREIEFVKNAHCFTKETFAMLYMLLEEREKQEAVITEIARRHGWEEEHG